MSSPRLTTHAQNTHVENDVSSEPKKSHFFHLHKVKKLDQKGLKINKKVMERDAEVASLHEQYLDQIEESKNNPDQPRKKRARTQPARLNDYYNISESDDSESENSVVGSPKPVKKNKTSTHRKINSKFQSLIETVNEAKMSDTEIAAIQVANFIVNGNSMSSSSALAASTPELTQPLMEASFTAPPEWNAHHFSTQGSFLGQQNFSPYAQISPITPINDYDFLNTWNSTLQARHEVNNFYWQLMQGYASQLPSASNFNFSPFSPPFSSGNFFPAPSLFSLAMNTYSYSAPNDFLPLLQSPPAQQASSVSQVDGHVLINLLAQLLNAIATQPSPMSSASSAALSAMQASDVSSSTSDNSVVVAVQEAKSAPNQPAIFQTTNSISVATLEEKPLLVTAESYTTEDTSSVSVPVVNENSNIEPVSELTVPNGSSETNSLPASLPITHVALVTTVNSISEIKALNTASVKSSEEPPKKNESNINLSTSSTSTTGLFKPKEKLKQKPKPTYKVFNDGTTEDQYWPSYCL